jgi:plasmid replication initiation protein
MARKKIEPITSLGNEDKLTVQKSLPLFALWRSELTLAEFKILDTYLSRIDSHKPDKRTVVFEKGELEKLLGVKRIRTEELDERLKHLGTSIRIDDSTSKNKKFARISLFEKAMAEQDDYGLWQVELTASQSAMKYIFNIENLGYLRYKLRCITSITSRYTYIMFIYLESNRRFRKSWEVPLAELKEILNCDKEELYKEFKFFNQKILKRVQKEMHEKTECRYDYEPIKKGRSVVAVRFTVETLPKASLEDIDPNQLTLEDWQNDTNRELWVSALEKDGVSEFSKEQIAEIRSLLVTVPACLLPDAADDDERYFHYLSQKMAQIARIGNEKRIRNKYGYLLAVLKKDILDKKHNEDTQQQTSAKIHNFTKREYTDEQIAAIESRMQHRT